MIVGLIRHARHAYLHIVAVLRIQSSSSPQIPLHNMLSHPNFLDFCTHITHYKAILLA